MFEGLASENGNDGNNFVLKRDEHGYHSGYAAKARAGMRYRLRLSGMDGLYADPISRFQPDGCRGPSEIVDASGFEWHDDDWPGVALPRQIIYELHIGTFTSEGTWGRGARSCRIWSIWASRWSR